MPILPTKLPAQQWLSESPSVFDSPLERAGRYIGNMLGLANPNSSLPTQEMLEDPLSSIVSEGVETLPKIAPKRAANELVDLLLGLSSRVPQLSVYRDVPDADLSLQALMQSRTGGQPPRPTSLRMSTGNPYLTAPSRILSRDPEVAKQYNNLAAFLGKTPTPQSVTVGILPKEVDTTPAFKIPGRPWSPKIENPVAKEAASITSTGNSVSDVARANNVKPMTIKQMQTMLDAPRKAYDAGIITKAEMQKRLTINQAKINDYKAMLGQVDTDLYNQTMENSINARNAKKSGSY